MSPDLTHDLRRLVALAERDLRERSERDDLPWAVSLRQQHSDALSAGRTALSWSEWRDGEIAQGAVAWVLGTVFVRFCEDNDLIARRWIAGPAKGAVSRWTPRLRSTGPTRSQEPPTGCGTPSDTWRTFRPAAASSTGRTRWSGACPSATTPAATCSPTGARPARAASWRTNSPAPPSTPGSWATCTRTCRTWPRRSTPCCRRRCSSRSSSSTAP